MNSFTVPIGPDGALVNVLIGLSRPALQLLRQQGRPLPSPVAIMALIDSGSQSTCLDPAVLVPLIPFGPTLLRFVYSNMPAAGGTNLASEYALSLSIVHPLNNPRANLTLPNHPILELPLGVLGYQALIGRDILDRCLIVHDGPGRVCTVAY